MKKLGVITIGEAPRVDIQSVFEKYLGSTSNVIQVGVLDGLTKEVAEDAFKPDENEYTVVSRFIKGESIKMSRNKITPVIQTKINFLEDQGCRQIFLLCTGVFHGLYTKNAVLIEPEKIIPPTVTGMIGDHTLGIIGPLPIQPHLIAEKWGGCKVAPIYASASPYVFKDEELRSAARTLKDQHVQLILLDCMGYVEEMKQMVVEEVDGIPVILSNALVVKMISELIS